MADFNYLEEVSTRIKTNREHLFKVDEELSLLNAHIHELPRRSGTESAFARMIGQEYHDELGDLERQKEKLVTEKDLLSSTIEADMTSLMAELTSPDLVIPLDPTPKVGDGNTRYSYKDGVKFNNVFALLSELLGLSVPLVIKDVMLSPSEIVIKATDEFEAKRKFINSISEIQKTLSIKKR